MRRQLPTDTTKSRTHVSTHRHTLLSLVSGHTKCLTHSTAPCLCRPHRHTLQRLSFSLIQHPVASCRDSSARKIFLACAVSCHPTPQKIEQRASTHTHTHTRAHEQTLLPLTFPDRETASPVAPCRCRLPDPPAGAGVVCVRVCLCLLHQRLFSTLHKHTYPPNSSVDPPPYTRCILIGRKCGNNEDVFQPAARVY